MSSLASSSGSITGRWITDEWSSFSSETLCTCRNFHLPELPVKFICCGTFYILYIIFGTTQKTYIMARTVTFLTFVYFLVNQQLFNQIYYIKSFHSRIFVVQNISCEEGRFHNHSARFLLLLLLKTINRWKYVNNSPVLKLYILIKCKVLGG